LNSKKTSQKQKNISPGKKKPGEQKDDSKVSKKFQYEFISSTSHQLRTPIASIQSSLDVLELYINKGNPARQKEVLGKIKKSISGLRDTLERVTILYKNELIKPRLNIQKLEPHKFFNDLLDELMIASNETCLININLDMTEKYIYADEFILKQILLNLINNAIKFSNEEGQIRLFIKSQRSNVIVSIKDEGIGISKKDIKNLFRPFYRGSNVSLIPGDGLGLAIVKKLCAIHKIKIELTSELNKGTEFTLIIPQKRI
jgi:signal transduction histidine kinase